MLRSTLALLLASQLLHAQDDTRAWAEAVVAQRLQDAEAAPDFDAGLKWLNVRRPLSLRKELKGKVVVLDFWCYCCINCIHVLPDLEHLEKKYGKQAFAVVGVHSAKFKNERDTEKIREAVRRYEIRHPVVNDGAFAVWRSYGPRSWPTFAIITPDGKLLGLLSGEGNRARLDALVAVLLERYKGKLNTDPLPIALENATRAPGMLAYPGKVLAHGDSIFIADSNHNRIVEVGLDGTFKRAWGDGERGLVDGAKPRFFRPQGLAIAGDTLAVADTENHAVRAIDLKTGAVTTLATEPRSSPWDVCWIDGTLYVAMAGTHQIGRVDPKAKRLVVVSGDGSEQRLDAPRLLEAAWAQPSGLAWDGQWLYVADSESSSIVRMGLDGPVETIAGAKRDAPRNLFWFGDNDGIGWGKRFQHPLAIELVDGVLYVADTYNHKIKRLDPKTREVKSLWGGFDEPGGLSHAGGVLYVADTNNHAIKTVELKTGKIATVELKGVPIPQAMAREGGLGDDWPALPGTEKRAVTLKGKSVVLELALPEGWKLTEGAPSVVRAGGKDVALSSTRTPLALGPGTHRIRLLYYVCQDEGTCRIRSVDIELTLEAGPDVVALRDIFLP